MCNRETQICRDYAEAVFARAINPLPPADFVPNWQDQPSHYKTYLSVERFPLPLEPPTHFCSLSKALARMATPQAEIKELTFDEVATMLLFTQGLLNRRISVSWNRDDWAQILYTKAVYGRGAASGGGLYPTEVYWVCGQGAPLLPGTYHYNSTLHAMERLFPGDVTERIRTAVFHHPAASSTNQFLLLAPNFWKNCFKYNTFGYHVITQDLGVLLFSLRLIAAGFNSDLPVLSWFQDEELNRLLGFDTLSDSVFAVLPIPSNQPVQLQPISRSSMLSLDGPLFSRTSFQRSKRLLRFPLAEEVHLATLIDAEPLPLLSETILANSENDESSGELVELPPPPVELLHGNITQLFERRRSSFGAFSGHVPLSRAELAILLYSASIARNYVGDVKQTDGLPHFTSLLLFIINVEGIERGAYAYDERRQCLRRVQQRDFSLLLQQEYSLQNYNMEEIGVLIAVAGSVNKMLEVYGNRGYRILNAEVGMVAQSVYMAATAISCGCGATLGFNNVGLDRALGLEGSDRRSLLYLLAGHEREGSASFDCRYI